MLLLLLGLAVLVVQRQRVEEARWDMRTLGRYGRAEAGFAVATDPEEWQRLRASLVGQPPLPEVDFRQEWVLAAFMGEKPTGGFRIDWESVRLEGRVLRAVVAETAPGPADVVTMVITYPGHLVALPRPRGTGAYTLVVVDRHHRERFRREVTF